MSSSIATYGAACRCGLVGISLLQAVACSASLPSLVAESRQVRAPERLAPASSLSLAALGDMIRAYRFAEQPIPSVFAILVEIGVVANDGLIKTVSVDLSQYLRDIVSQMGHPFVTRRRVETMLSTVFSPPSSPPTSAALQVIPDYVIEGSVMSAAVILAKDLSKRIDLADERRLLDAQLALGRLHEITQLKVGLSLQRADGIAEAGGTATYVILVGRYERGASLSFYVAGSGAGADRKMTVAQDPADALYEAIAAIVMQLFGHARRVPYCRAAGAPCVTDTLLSARVRDEMLRLSRIELEVKTKQLMFLHGLAVDIRSGQAFTPQDRELIQLQLENRPLDSVPFVELADYAFRLWETVDYRAAASRVDELMRNTAQEQRELEVARLQQSAGPQSHPKPPVIKKRTPRRPVVRRPVTRQPRSSVKVGDISCSAYKSATAANVSCTVRTNFTSSQPRAVADSSKRTAVRGRADSLRAVKGRSAKPERAPARKP